MIEIEYMCDVCQRPVEDGLGAVLVSFADLAEWRRQREHAPAAGGPPALTGPIVAPWRIQHDACADPADAYDIPVERIRTWRDVVAVTAQLLDKPWLTATDWAVLIGGGVRGEGARMVPNERGSAA